MGQRVTPQRVALLSVLLADESHPTAADLMSKLRKTIPNLSLATVYKNLAAMTRLGLVAEVEIPGHVARYEANLAPHVNFVCLSCHTVSDVEDPCIDEFHERLRSRTRTEVREIQVLVRGICARCRRKGRGARPSSRPGRARHAPSRRAT